MSFSLDGLNAKIKKSEITIKVKASHPLIMLANEIPWDELWTVAAEDLKGSTAKGFWNRGRKLYIRPHLGIPFSRPSLRKLTAPLSASCRRTRRISCSVASR